MFHWDQSRSDPIKPNRIIKLTSLFTEITLPVVFKGKATDQVDGMIPTFCQRNSKVS